MVCPVSPSLLPVFRIIIWFRWSGFSFCPFLVSRFIFLWMAINFNWLANHEWESFDTDKNPLRNSPSKIVIELGTPSLSLLADQRQWLEEVDDLAGLADGCWFLAHIQRGLYDDVIVRSSVCCWKGREKNFNYYPLMIKVLSSINVSCTLLLAIIIGNSTIESHQYSYHNAVAGSSMNLKDTIVTLSIPGWISAGCLHFIPVAFSSLLDNSWTQEKDVSKNDSSVDRYNINFNFHYNSHHPSSPVKTRFIYFKLRQRSRSVPTHIRI